MAEKVWCKHILQKHVGSRNPNDSYRKKPITRSLEEAQQNINNFKEQIKSMEDFDRIAAEFSECGSAANAGDLGQFGRGAMQKPFEEAAFQLQPGQMCHGVLTDSGVHIIFRLQ
jgi:peptidyl-prolyl cis-trans isomerase NIMA-interacting 1